MSEQKNLLPSKFGRNTNKQNWAVRQKESDESKFHIVTVRLRAIYNFKTALTNHVNSVKVVDGDNFSK